MDVRCDKCQARYRIDEARVGPQGLAMRCGKCGNTFRATRETAQPVAEPASAPPAPAPAPVTAAAPPARAAVPVAAAAKPAAAPPVPAKPPAPPAAATRAAPKPSEGGGATVMFSAPPTAAAAVIPAGGAAAPRAAAPPVPPPAAAAPARASAPAQKPGRAPAKPAGGGPAGSAVAPLGDEAAGRTMMFNAAAPLKTQPPSRTPAGTVKPLSKPTDAAGATLVFGAAPAAAQPPKTPVKGEQGANATILFGNAPPAIARTPAAQVPTPPPQTPPPPIRAEELAPAADAPAAGEAGAETASEPSQEDAGAQVSGGAAPEETEAAGQPEPAEQAPAWHGPPRALVIGVAAALGLVLVLGGVVLAVKKLGHRAPPQAAMDALADGHAAAEKDTLASLADAEAQTNAALQAAPKAHFPQAWAQLAEVQIAWSDALNDQAWYWSEQASRALASGDDKKKADAEAKAAALQDAAKARLKTAFEAAAAGNKMDPKSPEVAVALADYYRPVVVRQRHRHLRRLGVHLVSRRRRLERGLEARLGGVLQGSRLRFRVRLLLVVARGEGPAGLLAPVPGLVVERVGPGDLHLGELCPGLREVRLRRRLERGIRLRLGVGERCERVLLGGRVPVGQGIHGGLGRSAMPQRLDGEHDAAEDQHESQRGSDSDDQGARRAVPRRGLLRRLGLSGRFRFLGRGAARDLRACVLLARLGGRLGARLARRRRIRRGRELLGPDRGRRSLRRRRRHLRGGRPRDRRGRIAEEDRGVRALLAFDRRFGRLGRGRRSAEDEGRAGRVGGLGQRLHRACGRPRRGLGLQRRRRVEHHRPAGGLVAQRRNGRSGGSAAGRLRGRAARLLRRCRSARWGSRRRGRNRRRSGAGSCRAAGRNHRGGRSRRGGEHHRRATALGRLRRGAGRGGRWRRRLGRHGGSSRGLRRGSYGNGGPRGRGRGRHRRGRRGGRRGRRLGHRLRRLARGAEGVPALAAPHGKPLRPDARLVDPIPRLALVAANVHGASPPARTQPGPCVGPGGEKRGTLCGPYSTVKTGTRGGGRSGEHLENVSEAGVQATGRRAEN